MDLRTQVLCFSHDPVLLESRRRVLATRFRALSVTTLEALRECIASEQIELLVICHSVPEEECRAALALAGSGKIETMLLISTRERHCATGQTIHVNEGPLGLLNKLSDMLRLKKLVTGCGKSGPTMLPLSRPVRPLAEELRREALPSKRRSCRPQT